MTDNPPGVDLAVLTSYLEQNLPGLVTGPLSAELIPGGRSNLTYRLTDGEHRWVLRRPPLGHVLATAHDMSREFQVLSALAGTDVPVPEIVHLCADPEALGAPFYLMQEVDGTVLRELAQVSALGASTCAAIGEELIEVLARLHTIDPASIGLGSFGKPEGYLHRQVARWQKQLAASRSREVPGIEELHDRLAESVPETQRHSLLHGDYRLDNVLVDTTVPRISAVLDWEMAALGDPLADLGLTVVYSRRRPDDPLTGGVNNAPGFPSVEQIVSGYAARTGLDVSTLDWYVGLANFKLAVVAEGIYYRFTQGKTVGAGFERIGDAVTGLVQGGLAALDSLR